MNTVRGRAWVLEKRTKKEENRVSLSVNRQNLHTHKHDYCIALLTLRERRDMSPGRTALRSVAEEVACVAAAGDTHSSSVRGVNKGEGGEREGRV